ARDLDLLLLDARHPFGNGHCLPAGPLREPPEACRRADAVVLTRADRADLEERHKTREWLHAAGYEGPVLLARHRVLGVREAGEVRPASGLAVYCVSGIGRPADLAQPPAPPALSARAPPELPH